MKALVTAKSARAIKDGYPWVYRQDVVEAPSVHEKGTIVEVIDQHGKTLGQAFWSDSSPLALRMVTRSVQKIDDAFFKQRLELALARRTAFLGRDAWRMVHGEADMLPGLFVDRYGPALVMQTLSEGMDVRKEKIAQLLRELTGAELVVCRDDGSGRDFEKLTREVRVLAGKGETMISFHEGPHAFTADLLGDFKTGSFLDQVDNHLRASELAGGDALDTFSYHGGFAIALSRTCKSVLAVEQDEKAAERARENAKANHRENVEVMTANAFDVLKGFDVEGRKFDTIVLDPPGLAKREKGTNAAMRAYHELNLRAFRLLRPEGLLVTCSCSGKVSRDDFEGMLNEAAADAHRQVQVLERRGAGLDHPTLMGLHTTEYLKCYLLRVLG